MSVRDWLRRATGKAERAPGYRAFMTDYDEVVWADRIRAVGPVTQAPQLEAARAEDLRAGIARLEAGFDRAWPVEMDGCAVSLLVDHSGSMAGERIHMARAIAGSILRTGRASGVAVEILGFTTVDWHGAPVRTWWQQAGRPANPGRLCALRHIVYADHAGRSVALDLMLRHGVLKENVDGEAMDWAAARMQARHEGRRCLILVSDGAPMDDSTLSANGLSYLGDHAREVAARLVAKDGLRLGAVVLGGDFDPIYPEICRIDRLEEIEGALLDRILPWALGA